MTHHATNEPKKSNCSHREHRGSYPQRGQEPLWGNLGLPLAGAENTRDSRRIFLHPKGESVKVRKLLFFLCDLCGWLPFLGSPACYSTLLPCITATNLSITAKHWKKVQLAWMPTSKPLSCVCSKQTLQIAPDHFARFASCKNYQLIPLLCRQCASYVGLPILRFPIFYLHIESQWSCFTS